MTRRILTALALIPPVAYVIGWGPEWLFILVLMATVERSLYEYFTISRQAGFQSFPAAGYGASALLCLAQAAEIRRPETPGALGFLIVVFVLVLTLASALVSTSDLKQYFASTSSTILGILYIGGTLPCLVPLRFSPRSLSLPPGRELVLFLFLVVW